MISQKHTHTHTKQNWHQLNKVPNNSIFCSIELCVGTSCCQTGKKSSPFYLLKKHMEFKQSTHTHTHVNRKVCHCRKMPMIKQIFSNSWTLSYSLNSTNGDNQLWTHFRQKHQCILCILTLTITPFALRTVNNMRRCNMKHLFQQFCAVLKYKKQYKNNINSSALSFFLLHFRFTEYNIQNAFEPFRFCWWKYNLY